MTNIYGWNKKLNPEIDGTYLVYGKNGYDINNFKNGKWEKTDFVFWSKLKNPPKIEIEQKKSCNDCLHKNVCAMFINANSDLCLENECKEFLKQPKHKISVDDEVYVFRYVDGMYNSLEYSELYILRDMIDYGIETIKIAKKEFVKSNEYYIGKTIFKTKEEAENKLEHMIKQAEKIKKDERFGKYDTLHLIKLFI